MTHNLKLHPWPVDPNVLQQAVTTGDTQLEPPTEGQPAPELILSPVHSWQYEEVVFTEPTEAFYSSLLSVTPLPLPPKNRFPRQLIHRLGGGGNIGEFSRLMEAEEGQRLDDAKRKAEEEMAKMRNDLAQFDKDIAGESLPLVSCFGSWLMTLYTELKQQVHRI